jgi:hypothetical protein
MNEEVFGGRFGACGTPFGHYASVALSHRLERETLHKADPGVGRYPGHSESADGKMRHQGGGEG